MIAANSPSKRRRCVECQILNGSGGHAVDV